MIQCNEVGGDVAESKRGQCNVRNWSDDVEREAKLDRAT